MQRSPVEALADLDACARVAYEAVEDAACEGLAYLELRFSPAFMARPNDLAAPAVVEAVVDGVRRAERDTVMKTGLIGILSRTFGPRAAVAELEALLALQDELVALDLAGDEARWPGELFEEHFRRGRDAGWHTTVHAGEAAGATGIRFAVEELGAERIGHGVRAIEDEAVLDLLGERAVVLEISLTSNVQTATVPDYATHPLRELLDRGLRATINTDNPTASDTTLERELTVAAPAARLEPHHIAQTQRYAREAAFS